MIYSILYQTLSLQFCVAHVVYVSISLSSGCNNRRDDVIRSNGQRTMWVTVEFSLLFDHISLRPRCSSHKMSACAAFPCYTEGIQDDWLACDFPQLLAKSTKRLGHFCAALSMCVYGIQGGFLARTCCNFLDKSTKNLNIDLPTSSACSQGLNYKLCPGAMIVDQSTSECCGWSTEVTMAYII